MDKNEKLNISRQMVIVPIMAMLFLPMHSLADNVREEVALAETRGAEEQEYAIYQNQLNAQLCSLQVDYLAALKAQREEEWKIAQEKVKLGYAIPVDEQEAKGQYEIVQLQLESAEAQQQFYKEVIQLYGGEYQEIQVPDELEELQEDYTEGVGEVNLRINVKSLVLQYENTKREVTETDIQIDVLKGKIENALQLYETGRIARVQLGELETELKRLEYERMSLIYNAQLILYQLNHDSILDK